jgi:hypothetical protein
MQRLSAFTRVSCDECWAVGEGVVTWSFGTESHTAEAHDPIFGLRLLLQAPCCGDRLWAANLDELDSIETLVRGPRPTAERVLPAWMCSIKNRAEVLSVIGALREYVN